MGKRKKAKSWPLELHYLAPADLFTCTPVYQAPHYPFSSGQSPFCFKAIHKPFPFLECPFLGLQMAWSSLYFRSQFKI